MSESYLLLGLPITANPREVVRAAAKALHPDTRRIRGLRCSRKRFYRDMLKQHAAAQELLCAPQR